VVRFVHTIDKLCVQDWLTIPDSRGAREWEFWNDLACYHLWQLVGYLSKGYQIIKRFYEDIYFKVRLLQPDVVISKGSARNSRGAFQALLLELTLEPSPNLKLSGEVLKRNESTFVKFDISYPSQYVQNPAL
jgi:hypothetical protein